MSVAALTGGAAGGLTALTFIVVSIRLETITRSQELRSRSAQTLTVFLTVLVLAVVTVVPESQRARGIELLVVALTCGAVLQALNSQARREQTTRPSPALVTATTLFVALAGAGGLIVALGSGWGMYLYAAAATLGLIWGAVAAWTFLALAGETTSTTET